MSKYACVRPLLVAAALTALFATACGGSSRPVTHRAPPQPTTAGIKTAATASAGTASTPTAPATTSAPQRMSLCRSAALRLIFLGQQGATGHGEVGFELRNTSSRACRTFGYPGVQFFSGRGAALPTVPTRTTRDFFGATPEEPLEVAPGQGFSFRIGVTHMGPGGSNQGCTTAAYVQVIPPDDTGRLVVTVPEGIYECGAATVSAVRPGTSAYP